MNFKKIGATLLAMSMAAALAVAPATASKAATVGGGTDTVVYTNSFANRDTDANPLTEDESKVQASENLARYNLPTTVTISLKKQVSIIEELYVSDYVEAAQAVDSTVKSYIGITDVKSSSSKLKVKLAGRAYTETGYYEATIYAYAKKAGTYTVSYNLTYLDDNNAVQKEARTIKVIAKEYKPFKTVTFAGKSLWYDKSSASKYIYKTNDFTTKKSGKLVVKAAKGFKINKIEVGTYEKKTTSAESYLKGDSTTAYQNTDTTTYSFSGSITESKDAEDYYVNGNPVYDTYGNLIECKWKTVKSGKKVKLSTVIEGVNKYNYTVTTNTTDTDTKITTTTKSSYKYNKRTGNTAPTIIKITYTDTKTGQVHQWTKTIDKLLKK